MSSVHRGKTYFVAGSILFLLGLILEISVFGFDRGIMGWFGSHDPTAGDVLTDYVLTIILSLLVWMVAMILVAFGVGNSVIPKTRTFQK